jgi:hypothetical protein
MAAVSGWSASLNQGLIVLQGLARLPLEQLGRRCDNAVLLAGVDELWLRCCVLRACVPFLLFGGLGLTRQVHGLIHAKQLFLRVFMTCSYTVGTGLPELLAEAVNKLPVRGLRLPLEDYTAQAVAAGLGDLTSGPAPGAGCAGSPCCGGIVEPR